MREERKVRVLGAMRRCRKEIDNEALEGRCVSRVNRIEGIVDKYRRTLDPHDFCLSVGDVCRIPGIRKVIIDGTDEEFNTCAEEVTARFPELTLQFFEEPTARLLALLPFNGRSNNALSLATALFTCG